MSTNEQNKIEEINQNGNRKSEALNLLENTSPNLVESDKNSKTECDDENVNGSILKNESTLEKRGLKNELRNIHETVDYKENNRSYSSAYESTGLLEDSNLAKSIPGKQVLEASEENSVLFEADMSRSNMKSRLPNKTASRSALPHNTSKVPGELSGQPSVKNTKEDVKYWKNREQELLSKIAELESKAARKDSQSHGPLDSVATQIQEKLENELVVTTREKENYKNRLQTIEKELCNKQKEISTDPNFKNLKSSDEIINHLKSQNEDLRNALAKMTAILRDKTTMCISQEKKIAALVNQVESLKEVVAITKDLLNIRNMEVQHLSNDISAMETKIDCERQRHNQMLIKMDEAVKLNSELKKEYENQLKLFQHLRDSYEEKIILLSRDKNIEKNENPAVEKGIEKSSNSPVQNFAPK